MLGGIVMKKSYITLVLFFLLGCLFVTSNEVNAKSNIMISKKNVTIRKKTTISLCIKNPASRVKWSVSNKKIIKIKKVFGSKKQKCKISLIKNGKATVIAKVGIKKYKCRVTVRIKKKSRKNTKLVTNDKEVSSSPKENSDIETERSAYGTMMAFVVVNGSLNSDKNFYVDAMVDSNSLASIEFDAKKHCVNYTCLYTNGIESVYVQVEVSESDPSKGKVGAIYRRNDITIGYGFIDNIDIYNITSEDKSYDWQITGDISGDSRELFDALLKLGRVSWDYLLIRNGADFKLEDLGFGK